MKTAQEIFDTVVNHLRQQNEKSTIGEPDDTVCAYRGTNGKKCAVGCLISDDEYFRRMEGLSVLGVVDLNPSLNWMVKHDLLLSSLQDCHDGVPVSCWEIQFEKIANHYKLVYTPKESNV